MVLRHYFYSTFLMAANVAVTKRYFAPPDATRRWLLVSVTLIPNETSAVNGNDYATVDVKRGSTALVTPHSTAATVLTQATPVIMEITGTKLQREITQAAPLWVGIDTSPGSGVAVDCQVMVEFEEQRI